jgi:hypothetical protein
MLPNKQQELLRICEFLEPSLLFHEVQNQRSAAILRTQLVFYMGKMSVHELPPPFSDERGPAQDVRIIFSGICIQ